MNKPIHWVHDYETLINCFTAVFQHYKTDETRIFVVHELRNDFDELVVFLRENQRLGQRHISFNGLAFDAQITHYILIHYELWRELPPKKIAHEIYKRAQHVINLSNNREWLDFYESKMVIPQIDVYKLNHWDNAAKRSSLKWIQYSMDWHNLQDMPIHHETMIHTQEELDMIIEYNINDVESTKAILHKSKSEINLRKDLTNAYGIPLYNASEPRIAKDLFLYFLVQKTKMNKWDLKNSKTKRVMITVDDIILPYIKFKTPEFNGLLTMFQELIIFPDQTKGGFKHSVNYHGMRTDFGLGGVHGARSSSVYEATEGMTIMTSDVTSFYPNLAIRNNWAPAHLPKQAFVEQYEWFFDERKKIPKKDPRNYVYKIILNSTYGLSNDKYCYLYDPQFTMQITVNGQLSLMMLYEMIQEEIPGAIPLMQNTDGLETIIAKKHIPKYMEICERWEKLTNLNLEHEKYQKLILADVNNYIAINKYKEVDKQKYHDLKKDKSRDLFKEKDGKFYWAGTKDKGRFEIDKALHKNKSNKIVTLALFDYFVHDVPPETTLSNNKNIFDYCSGKKIRGAWQFKTEHIEDGKHVVEDQQKTIRYYISNKGCKIMKHHKTDGRVMQLEAGKWVQTMYNNHKEIPWEDYDINEDYYLQAIYREIENVTQAIKKSQLKFF